MPHICVLVCTYKRREMLRQLLAELDRQDTGGRFTYSIVVADNDRAESGRAVVAELAAGSAISVLYLVEPRQNIALARNKTVEKGRGDYLAFIDDDETPAPDWLSRLLAAIEGYGADGVLGPVLPRFASTPAPWIVRGRFFERPSPPSGTWLRWKQTRTGNALLRAAVFDDPANRFREECGAGGEDVDFFRRMIDKGMRFVWSAEAVVYETVPDERARFGYLLRRALERGRAPHNQGWPVALSTIAIPVYAAVLPLSLLLGRHVFIRYLIKECDHLGRIAAFLGRQLAVGTAAPRPRPRADGRFNREGDGAR
jgi:glycosyltransferase involved in cell wall biosynthesis